MSFVDGGSHRFPLPPPPSILSVPAAAPSDADLARTRKREDDAGRQQKSRELRRFRTLARTAGLLAAVLIGGATLYYYVEHNLLNDRMVHREPIETPPTPAPVINAIAAEYRDDGLKACAARDWKTCAKKLNIAKVEDERLEKDPEILEAERVMAAAIAKENEELQKEDRPSKAPGLPQNAPGKTPPGNTPPGR
jgi:hypothetical protein